MHFSVKEVKMTQMKNPIISALASILVLFFIQSASAEITSAIKAQEALTIHSLLGTDSAGSYAYGEKKSEGSKTKTAPRKSEGSKSKAYSKKRHGYNPHKKSEGSGKKSYSGHHGSKSGHKNHAYSAKHKKHHYSKDSSHGSHKSYSKHGGHSAHSSKCFFSHLLNFRHQLQLTDSQVEGIQKMRFEYRKNSVMLKAEKEVAKMEFDRLVHGKTVDASAIRAAGEKIIAAKTKKIRAKVEAKIAVMKLLTDEQRNQVHKMHASH